MFCRINLVLTQGRRRFSTSLQAMALNYKASNEPGLTYEVGSKERQQLEAKLQEFESKEFDVPIVIGDEEIRTSDVHHQVRPFDHQKTLCKFSYADKKLIQKAIDTSQRVRAEWERRPLEERAEILLRAADLVSGKYRMDLMAATMLGQGKTIVQAEIDTAQELADFYRFNVTYASELVNYQPLSTDTETNKIYYRGMEGFWAAISPFNFTAIGGHLSMAPAFMGNVVLWKPSDTSMLSGYIVYQLLREAGVPAGVINFVPADGPTFGDVITSSPLLAGINFTGSVRTFKTLWKLVAQNIDNYKTYPRMIGECGGKNYHLVHPSADVQSVVIGTVKSAFEYSGQKCSACSRVYAPKSLWPEIRKGMAEVVGQMKVGSPLSTDSYLSSVIDDKAFDRIKGYVDHIKSSPHISLVAGGTCDNSKGYFVHPTICETTDPHDKIMQEEVFGPVLAVYVYEDSQYDKVVDMVNETSPYGLTGALFAKDQSVIEETSDKLRQTAGNFYINDKSTGSVVGQQPFGGARASGTNDKAGGPHYLLKFVSPQAIKETKVPLTSWGYSYMNN